jgi:hypothetical protein
MGEGILVRITAPYCRDYATPKRLKLSQASYVTYQCRPWLLGFSVGLTESPASLSKFEQTHPFFNYVIDRVGNKATIEALRCGDLVNRESRIERWEGKKERVAHPVYGEIMQAVRRHAGMRIP